MTGEGVEGIIVMLVIVFAIFHMVRKTSRQGLQDLTRRPPDRDSSESDEK